MRQSFEHQCNRRRFLGLAFPACAMTCFALKGEVAAAQGTQTPGQVTKPPSPHPFDEPRPRPFTFRESLELEYADFIPLTQHLTRTLGRAKGLQLLEEYGEQTSVESAERLAQRAGGRDFEALKRFFSPSPPWSHMLTFDVVESTARVHELKVTECLWAQIWRKAGAAAEGFAVICHADYTTARAFDPNIEMVRDKTLMQGDAYCNHRYLWKA